MGGSAGLIRGLRTLLESDAMLKLSGPFCLASASPRRKELLQRFGLEFTVRVADIDETRLPGETAREMVARLAGEKAGFAARALTDTLVLGADTVVVADSEILGKPHGPEEAKSMLLRLSGRSHRVLSAYSLRDGLSGRQCSRTVESVVTFRNLTPKWINWYAGHPEAQDKAGAYGIQGLGGAMVAHLAGSYNNVVGLPVESVIWDMLDNGWLCLKP